VYKGELYVWIIQIIADKSEEFQPHAFVGCLMAANDGNFVRQLV
jgi:hypothetical protein